MGFFDKAVQAVGGGDRSPGYELTEIGDKKFQEVQANSAELMVLSGIKRHAPCDSSELVKDPQIKLSIDQIRTVMENLYSKGWIRRCRSS